MNCGIVYWCCLNGFIIECQALKHKSKVFLAFEAFNRVDKKTFALRLPLRMEEGTGRSWVPVHHVARRA